VWQKNQSVLVKVCYWKITVVPVDCNALPFFEIFFEALFGNAFTYFVVWPLTSPTLFDCIPRMKVFSLETNKTQQGKSGEWGEIPYLWFSFGTKISSLIVMPKEKEGCGDKQPANWARVPVCYGAHFALITSKHQNWLSVFAHGRHAWCTIPVMSLNRFTISFPLEHDILAFFDQGNMSVVHWRICLLVSKSYWNTLVSSAVTAFFRKAIHSRRREWI